MTEGTIMSKEQTAGASGALFPADQSSRSPRTEELGGVSVCIVVCSAGVRVGELTVVG